MKFEDEGEFEYEEKRKNAELQLELERMRSRNRTIIALIGLIGVIFASIVPIIPVSSKSSDEKLSIISAIFFVLVGNDTDSPETTPTPDIVASSEAQTLTAISPSQTPVEPTTRSITNTPKPQSTNTPETVVITATLELQSTTTPISITPFCAFLTLSQISSLQEIQGIEAAIRQAEKFAGYRQNDYKVGDTIPRNVVIATNLYTTNHDKAEFDSIGVVPINNSGGSGLFLTTQEIVASYPGTYWCVEDISPVPSPSP